MSQKREEYNFKPKLRNYPPPATSNEEAGKKRVLTGHNISSFFQDLYAFLVGGKVIGKPYANSLDVRRTINGVVIDTEVKASSLRTGKITCTEKQGTHYCEKLIGKIDSDKAYQIEYATFKYGKREDTKLHRYNKSQLVKILSENIRYLNIFSFNSMLFILYDAVSIKRNQGSSNGPDEVYHKYPKGKLLGKLNNNPNALFTLIEKRRLKEESLGIGGSFIKKLAFEDLFLDKIKFEKLSSPEIKANYYGRTYKIKSFPVARYFMTEKDNQRWQKHFLENHERILESLCIENLYDDDIPF